MQVSRVREIRTHGSIGRGVETGRQVPRRPSTLPKGAFVKTGVKGYLPCARRLVHPLVRPPIGLQSNVLQPGPETVSESQSRLTDLPKELGMVLEPILEPVFL